MTILNHFSARIFSVPFFCICLKINALKNNGSADKIIKDFKEKEAADRYFARQIKETEERNAQNRIWIAENPQECETLKEVLLKNWGIKK